MKIKRTIHYPDGTQETEEVENNVGLDVYARNYRDERIKDIVSFNGVEAINEPGTAAKLDQIIRMLELQGDADATIDWKGPNDWHEASLNTLRGLFARGGEWEQKVWSAYKHIVTRHETTPYETWEDAKADFDARLAA